MTTKKTASPEFLAAVIKADNARRARRAAEIRELIKTIPVSDELLKEIAWTGPGERPAILRSHPGHGQHEKLKSLDTVLAIFNRCVADVMRELDRFHAFSLTRQFGRRTGEAELNEIESAVNKELMAFSTAAAALVDHARIVEKAIPIPGYKSQQLAIFDSGEHRFVKVLRNLINHARFPYVSWQIEHGADRERLTDFVLPTELLLELEALLEDADGIAFVRASGKDVHLRQVVASYSKRVNDFYAWHSRAIEANVPLSLADYRRCDAHCNAEVARTWWRIILSQTKADPYNHLETYLLPGEIEEAMTLPMRSKEQIDYIISKADKHNACDDEIRGLVYKYFGLNS
jgi:hypothetical protein